MRGKNIKNNTWWKSNHQRLKYLKSRNMWDLLSSLIQLFDAQLRRQLLYFWWCIMTYGLTNTGHRQIGTDKNQEKMYMMKCIWCIYGEEKTRNNVYDSFCLHLHWWRWQIFFNKMDRSQLPFNGKWIPHSCHSMENIILILHHIFPACPTIKFWQHQLFASFFLFSCPGRGIWNVWGVKAIFSDSFVHFYQRWDAKN